MVNKTSFILSLFMAIAMCGSLEAQRLLPKKSLEDFRLPVLSISEDSLRSYYANGVRYPDSLLNSEDNNTPRMTKISFLVSKDCHVSDIQATGGSVDTCPYLANEVLRLTENIPFAEPAMRYDSVSCQWVPEDFKLKYYFHFTPHSADRVWNKDSIISRLSHYYYSLSEDNGWGNVNDGWILQRKLIAQTSIDEKIALLKHSSPTVRLTAFDGIIESGYPRALHLLVQQLADKNWTIVKSFDVLWDEYVTDVMISNLYSSGNAVKLYSVADSLMLDSLILFDFNVPNLGYKASLMSRIEPREGYYHCLRELYIGNGFGSALTALAKYKKEADKQLIIDALLQYHKGLDNEDVLNGEPKGFTHDALNAIQLWPDNDFWPALTKVRDYETRRIHFDYPRIRALLKAVMAYDNDFSYQFLVDSFNQMKSAGNNSPYFYFAIELERIMEDHPNSRYKDLTKKYKPRE